MRTVAILIACVLFVGLLMLPSACTTAPAAYNVPPPTRTPTMDGLVGAYLAAEQAGAEAQRVSGQATLQAANAQATVQAAQAQATSASAVIVAQSQATAQAINARATVQYLDAQATAAAWSLQATMEAASRQGTATAEAQRATATAEAQRATATAEAQRATATTQAAAWSVQATSTVAAAHGIATAQAAAAEQARLEAERARLVYPVRAYGPWALFVAFGVLLVWGGYRLIRAAEVRARAVPRDPRGDAPVLVLPLPNGGLAVYDPDRSFGPATIIDGKADPPVTAPQLALPDYQERTTARDQAVDLKTRGLPAQRTSPSGRAVPVGMMRPALLPAQGPMIRIVRPEQVRPWLEDVEGQLALTAGGESDG